MNETQKLQQHLLFNRALTVGLCGVLSSLFVAHVRQIGGDIEIAISQTRRIITESLLSFSVSGTTTDGEKMDILPDVQSGLTRLINETEVSARRMLGQTLGTSKVQ